MCLDNILDQQNDNRIARVVVGIVTNNQDPDGNGRVRVNFPWRGEEGESYWARVASLMAGNERGIVFYPEVDDANEPQKPHVDVGGLVIGAGYEGEQNKFYGGLKIGSGTGQEKILDQLNNEYIAVDAASYTIGIILGMNYNF